MTSFADVESSAPEFTAVSDAKDALVMTSWRPGQEVQVTRRT